MSRPRTPAGFTVVVGCTAWANVAGVALPYRTRNFSPVTTGAAAVRVKLLAVSVQSVPWNRRWIVPSALTTEMANTKRVTRSEEHTSELQSRLHLVCRLLLEKKNENMRLYHV